MKTFFQFIFYVIATPILIIAYVLISIFDYIAGPVVYAWSCVYHYIKYSFYSFDELLEEAQIIIEEKNKKH